MSSSKIILQAMGLSPDGVPARKAGVCALCGLKITKGDLCSPTLDLGPSFMDDAEMAARGSQQLCGYCVKMKTKEPLRESGYGVFCAAGHLPFRKWADIGNSLVNPPEPPFCMTYATNNNQHMAWRAPVNLSRDLFYVRVGLRDLKIRRKKLIEAVEHCRVLGEAIKAGGTKTGTKTNGAVKIRPNPFAAISPDLKDPSHGRFKVAAYAHEQQQHVEALLSLTQGEIWALRFVLSTEVNI